MEVIKIKIITINLPIAYIKAIQALNDLGIYPSRSEALRQALKEFLQNEFRFYEDLDSENFKELIRGANN